MKFEKNSVIGIALLAILFIAYFYFTSQGQLELEAKQKQMKEFAALGEAKRAAMIKENEDEMAKLESDFKTFVDGLQKQYSDAQKAKEDGVEKIKNSGLGLLKAVHAHVKKTGKNEL